MGTRRPRWPLLRQLQEGDVTGLDGTDASDRTRGLRPRTESAEQVARSICPFCAVGCGQLVYVKDGRILDIEGDPDSPISRGCLCPKGAATFQLVTGSHRVKNVLYRRPGGTDWATLSLEHAIGRRFRVLAGILGAAGALATKLAVARAGHASARDPRLSSETERADEPAAGSSGTWTGLS